jgi:hypothetical protein
VGVGVGVDVGVDIGGGAGVSVDTGVGVDVGGDVDVRVGEVRLERGDGVGRTGVVGVGEGEGEGPQAESKSPTIRQFISKLILFIAVSPDIMRLAKQRAASSACLRDHRLENMRNRIPDHSKLPRLGQVGLELNRQGEIQHLLVRAVSLCYSLDS